MDLLIGYKRQSLSRLSLSSCTLPLSDAVILGNPGRRSAAAQSCAQELRDSLLYRIRPTLLSNGISAVNRTTRTKQNLSLS
jgi:hypothetical protein